MSPRPTKVMVQSTLPRFAATLAVAAGILALTHGMVEARRKKTWDQKIEAPPSTTTLKRRQLQGGPPAEPGVPFVSQPFDPDRLATVNTYGDTQGAPPAPRLVRSDAR